MEKEENHSNIQSRKWQLTINNPSKKGYDHETIKQKVFTLKSLRYFCLSDEVAKSAYSARTAHPFRRNGAPFRFKLSKAQLVD